MSKRWAMLAAWPLRKYRDWFNSERFTHISVVVPMPQDANDPPTLLVSLSTSPKHRVTFRVKDLQAWKELWQIPEDVRQRLQNGLNEAMRQHRELIEDDRLAILRRSGIGLARIDTGEVVSEAERILQGGADGKP